MPMINTRLCGLSPDVSVMSSLSQASNNAAKSGTADSWYSLAQPQPIEGAARATSEQIAEIVGLSPAAVQRRIKRMREQKVIQADVAIIAPKALGHNMTFVVGYFLKMYGFAVGPIILGVILGPMID